MGLQCLEFGPVDIQKVSIEIFSLPSNFYCYFRNYFILIFTLKVTIEKNTPSRNLFLRIQVPGAQIFRYSNFSLIFLRKIRCFYAKKFLENEFFSIVTYIKEALVLPAVLFLFPLVCLLSVKIYAVKVATALVLTLKA